MVQTKLPKFRNEFSADLNEVLGSMGMTDVFDPLMSDLSGIDTTSTGMLYISQVLHKTFITVDDRGTKAGAATVVEVGVGADME